MGQYIELMEWSEGTGICEMSWDTGVGVGAGR
jgi:hypothetical protein